MEKINNHDFFYRGKPSKFHITPDLRVCIRDLVHETYEGAYNDGILWKLEDNLNIVEKFGIDPNTFFNNIAIAMQFIVRSTKMEQLIPAYIEINNIKEYHIQLLNRLYIDCDSDEEIYTADKRPFGNSHMEGDIFEEMGISVDYGDEPEEDEEGNIIIGMNEDEASVIAQRVYKEVLDLALHVFKNENLPYYRFEYVGKGYWDDTNSAVLHEIQEKYLNHEWTIAYSEFIAKLRDEKIDEILNDKNI